MSSSKDIKQQITRPLLRAGWDIEIGGGGHALAKLGEHRIAYSTTPSDYRAMLNVKRWIKQCREGRCQHGDPPVPASKLESKPTPRKRTTMKNRIAKTYWTANGRLAVRLITERGGRQLPYDIVVTPTDSRVWEGHMLTEGSDPLSVLLDFDKGEAMIGSLTVNGLPLDSLLGLKPPSHDEALTVADAAALTGRTPAGIRAAVNRGAVRAGPPAKGGRATVLRASLLAWNKQAEQNGRAKKAAGIQAAATDKPIQATPEPSKGITPEQGGESGESLTAPHLTAAYAYEMGKLEGMMAMLRTDDRRLLEHQLRMVKRAIQRGEEA